MRVNKFDFVFLIITKGQMDTVLFNQALVHHRHFDLFTDIDRYLILERYERGIVWVIVFICQR